MQFILHEARRARQFAGPGERDRSADGAGRQDARIHTKKTMKTLRNAKDRQEMDQVIGGTRPVEFENEARELRVWLVSDKEWMRWAYLHRDHHWQQ